MPNKARGEQWTIQEGETLAEYREAAAALRDAWAKEIRLSCALPITHEAVQRILDIDGFHLDDAGR